ncbi:hypothetical protein GCM10027175_40010 [Hymenobacter latericoloratus]
MDKRADFRFPLKPPPDGRQLPEGEPAKGPAGGWGKPVSVSQRPTSLRWKAVKSSRIAKGTALADLTCL